MSDFSANENIISLNSINLNDWNLVGNKAAVLGWLLQEGYPIPKGISVKTSAFIRALEPFASGIQEIKDHYQFSKPSQAKTASKRILQLITDLSLPVDLTIDLQISLAESFLPYQQLAVRSSATNEDSRTTSLAGQYLTRLGVRGWEAIHNAIVEVWKSFYSPNALEASTQQESQAGKHAMAVLIQPMIDAECAGVCFSIDPIHPGKHWLMISATWGQGIGVVEGSTETDTYHLQRSDLRIIDSRIGEKDDQFILHPTEGIKRVQVPPSRKKTAVLPQNWVQRIAEFGIALEMTLGCPQEIEWAIAEGKVWILQSRPITTLPEQTYLPIFPVTWDNPQERRYAWYPVPFGAGKPLLPVEWDYLEAATNAKVDAALFSGMDKIIQTRLFNGFPFYCELRSPLSEGDRRIRQAMMTDLGERLTEQGLTTWDYWGPEIITATNRLHEFDLTTPNGPDLATHLEDAFGALRRHWMVHGLLWEPALKPLNQIYAALSGLNQHQVEEPLKNLLQGEANSLTEMIEALFRFAVLAKESPFIYQLIKDAPTNILNLLEDRETPLDENEHLLWNTFRVQFLEFIEKYGDRTGKGFGSENTILMPTWREDPRVILNLIEPYLTGPIENPVNSRQRARQAIDAQLDSIMVDHPNKKLVQTFQRYLTIARKEAANLENHNHYIDQKSGGQLRAALLAAGLWLKKNGIIETVNDVFWLRFVEICNLLRGESGSTITATITERKTQQEIWMNLSPPPILGQPDPQLTERPHPKDELSATRPQEPGRIFGQGASPGRYKGRAKIISVDTLLPKIDAGDILVAENAGPRWTPLFPALGGIVLDQGSLGQHAAVTAREYGIPAVIRAGEATHRIQDGSMITIDGSTGVIEFEPIIGDSAA